MGRSSKEAQYQRQARERNKEYIREIKEKHPCVDCEQFYHFSQMDFDHVKGHKKNNLSKYANSSVSIKTIKDELAKCELVCANCHRLRTWKRTQER